MPGSCSLVLGLIVFAAKIKLSSAHEMASFQSCWSDIYRCCRDYMKKEPRIMRGSFLLRCRAAYQQAWLRAQHSLAVPMVIADIIAMARKGMAIIAFLLNSLGLVLT